MSYPLEYLNNGPARVTSLEGWLVRKVFSIVGDPAIRIALWNGEEFGRLAGDRSVPALRVHDRSALYELAIHPQLTFGDLFSAGRVTVEGDLVSFLEAVSYALLAQGRPPLGARLRDALRDSWYSNTERRARDNVHHHYDLGNAFYALWLDREAMQYTCAYYPAADMSLEQAQQAKMAHICRKLRLRPGETVVEAGCGWGGFALYMARHHGVTVRAYNISHEQVSYARERAAREGLADRVQYFENDYRNIDGTCDAFVSVGMLEHVGPEHYAELGNVIDRCLTSDGRGLIHTIGRNRPGRLNPWIEKRIFPGGFPPTVKQIMEVIEPVGLSVLDVENLRLHYARTLQHWLERYEQHVEQVEQMFDERFVRAWRLYLCGSIAGFTTGSLQLFQVLFVRPRQNDLPWSRAHLYPASG